MRSRLALIGLLGLGLALIGWALFARETDEEAIRRRLDAIAAAVAIQPGEGVVPRALRVKDGLEESIAKDAQIEVPEVGNRLDREALIGAAIQAGQRWSTGDLGYSDVTIEVRGGADAHVRATAELTGSVGNEPRTDERRLALDLAKRDGEWVVTRVEVAPEGEEDEEVDGS